MSPRTKSILKLMDFLKVADSFEKSAGFSSLLGLSYAAVASLPQDHILTFDASKPAVLKFHLSTHQLSLSHQKSVALSTYLAIIDDVTTWALVLADPGRGRPGVSVSLRTEWGPAALKCCDMIEIEAEVIKVGRNLGFTQAHVRDTKSGELVCFGSHVKYLPMGFLGDLALSSYGWPVLKLYSDYYASPSLNAENKNTAVPPNLADVFDSFQVDQESTSASFIPSSIHASLGGPLHGGCQAILMELAATHMVKQHLQTTSGSLNDYKHVRLESMSVEYLSSPKSKNIELRVKPISKQPMRHLTMNVELLSGGRMASKGVLQFISTSPTPQEHSRL